MPSVLARILSLAAAAVLLALLTDLVRGRVRVRGVSMAPALLPGDDLLTSRLLLFVRPPRRGDIMVVSLSHPDAPDRLDLKRIVGLPGERIAIRGGRVLVNGVPLPEPYVELPDESGEEQEWLAGPGQFFVLGDNRPWSTDSRRYGPVPRAALRAVAWWRTGPGQQWGQIGRPDTDR